MSGFGFQSAKHAYFTGELAGMLLNEMHGANLLNLEKVHPTMDLDGNYINTIECETTDGTLYTIEVREYVP